MKFSTKRIRNNLITVSTLEKHEISRQVDILQTKTLLENYQMYESNVNSTANNDVKTIY